MIYISTAFYQEASPMIQAFSLNKLSQFSKYQVFGNEHFTLFITNPGPIASCIGSTYVLSGQRPEATDLFVNLGICGCTDTTIPIGTPCLCTQINESLTGRVFYPDVLFSHPFLECCLETHPGNISDNSQITSNAGTTLVDCEAASLYQSAQLFFQIHQMLFIKIVSDYLEPQSVTDIHVRSCIECNLTAVFQWLENIQQSMQTACANSLLDVESIPEFHLLASQLKLSATMKAQLKQLLNYSQLKGKDTGQLLSLCLEKTAQCNTKLEGKNYFEQFKQQLI
ncbi:hypothetical protein [Anaeromicropila populeti]|uniref:Nucleoside phosphorylase n=1 Tax=Anaeromicropila populeti TaxID=37658 RepID=A0A1I6KKX1_9FIRM|nr:hypothetical protein [Anaeromicropila populeti]SFR91688.1 hypothetical protein SAMN05661086_02488 [Anaeromicropila populeti]